MHSSGTIDRFSKLVSDPNVTWPTASTTACAADCSVMCVFAPERGHRAAMRVAAGYDRIGQPTICEAEAKAGSMVRRTAQNGSADVRRNREIRDGPQQRADTAMDAAAAARRGPDEHDYEPRD